MMVVLVSTSDPGLEIFPTHRLFRGHDDALPPPASAIRPRRWPPSPASRQLPYDRAHAVGYRKGVTFPVTGEARRARRRARRSAVGHEGLAYTADLERGGRARRRGRVRRRVPASADPDRGRVRARPARRGDAAEDDVLLPQADERPALPPRMTIDWLSLCRACVADIDVVLEELPTRAEREPVLRAGEGGDDTTAIDAAAEDAVVAPARGARRRLRARLGGARRARLRQRRAGPRRRRPDRRLGERQARDPVLLALARGRRRPDDGRRHVRLRLRLRRARGVGGGAWPRRACSNGAPLETPAAEGSDRDPLVRGARRPRTSPTRRSALLGVAERLRVMGSLALSLCHLAAGRVDAVCSLKPARSIDIAAAQLLVRERGYAIELFEEPPFAERAARSRRPFARRRGRDSGAVRRARSRADARR